MSSAKTGVRVGGGRRRRRGDREMGWELGRDEAAIYMRGEKESDDDDDVRRGVAKSVLFLARIPNKLEEHKKLEESIHRHHQALVGQGVVENLGIEIRVLVYCELGFKELTSRVLVIARIVRFPSSKFPDREAELIRVVDWGCFK
ncbi:hypothetical protein AKJ16_DCAP04182 [Drosera capensis]